MGFFKRASDVEKLTARRDLQGLLQLIQDESADVSVRESAFEAGEIVARELGPASTPLLLPLLDHEKWPIRDYAARLLGFSGDMSVLGPVVALGLQHPDMRQGWRSGGAGAGGRGSRWPVRRPQSHPAPGGRSPRGDASRPVTLCVDSWAILEWLSGGEPATPRVSEVLDAERPVMSWINLGEVAYVVQRWASAEDASTVVAQLRGGLTLDVPDPDLVLAAAAVKARYPLAYADAFAIATTEKCNATLLTGDPETLDAGGPWELDDLRHRRPRTRRR